MQLCLLPPEEAVGGAHSAGLRPTPAIQEAPVDEAVYFRARLILGYSLPRPGS